MTQASAGSERHTLSHHLTRHKRLMDEMVGTMNLRITKPLAILICAGILLGCAAGAGSNGSLRVGQDGSVHPDGTGSIAGYTGQGDGGQGWAGDDSGEGGPSAERPAADDLIPR
jgi:hypothetical protein